MAKLYNLAAMTVASTGTGTITLGAAATINGIPFLSFAASGVADGDVVAYSINDVNGTEQGTGTYTAAGTTLTRSVTRSTNANAAISMSAAAIVRITPRKEDVANLGESNTFATGTTQTMATLNTTGNVTVSNSDATNAQTVVGASKNWTSGNALNVMAGITAYNDLVRYVIQRANGTIASPTGINAGETILNLAVRGYTSAGAFSPNTAIIMAVAEETYSATIQGTRWSFFTTPIGTAAPTEAMRIFPSGGVGIGTTTDPGIGMLATNSASFMLRTKMSLTGGSTGNVPTLTTGPVTGNPTKWLPYDDNGTTRYIPAW